jgi:hypothetical protein
MQIPEASFSTLKNERFPGQTFAVRATARVAIVNRIEGFDSRNGSIRRSATGRQRSWTAPPRVPD